MEAPFKLGLYVLLVLPGFILVQTREYYLLRQNRSQFENTLDIILWSAAIWIIACSIPIWWPRPIDRDATLARVAEAFGHSANGSNPDWIELLVPAAGIFFGTVCLWAFVVANIWGIFRKSVRFNTLVQSLTGRDWYPSVAHKFFYQNIGRVVVVGAPENRYLGVLHSAPDTKEDKYLILHNVARLPKPGEPSTEPEDLPYVRWVLVKFDDIIEVQALTREVETRIDLSRLARVLGALKLLAGMGTTK
jgi:hypothetical protein